MVNREFIGNWADKPIEKITRQEAIDYLRSEYL